MTKKIEETLGLRSMIEALAAFGVQEVPEDDDVVADEDFGEEVDGSEGVDTEQDTRDDNETGSSVAVIPDNDIQLQQGSMAANAVAVKKVVIDIKDNDDVKSEQNLTAIYDSAMTLFADIAEQVLEVEPKHAGKMSDSAAKLLGIALSAEQSKMDGKNKRKRLALDANKFLLSGVIAQQRQEQEQKIVGTRSELLRNRKKQESD